MSKTIVIAVREYLAAVKTKGFLVGLILMPLLMGGGILVQTLTKGMGEGGRRTIAVLDRTPGETLWPVLKAEAERVSAGADPAKKQALAYALERVDPAAFNDRRDDTRLAISERIRKGDVTAFVEIGPGALAPRDTPATTQGAAPFAALPTRSRQAGAYRAESGDADDVLFFTTNRPALTDVRAFVESAVRPTVLAARLNQSPDAIRAVVRSSDGIILSRGMASRKPDGSVSFEPRSNELAAFMLPLTLVVVMFMIVLVGASPLTTNIIEEKQLRIAEVLVGSVTPFTLMLGKLLGGVATSLTLGAIYAAGAMMVAKRMGFLAVLTPGMAAWFVAFTIVACLMYGALFVVAGAAATNIKEAQALMTPLMLVVVTPMFMIGPLMSEPHGTLGLVGTFFPLSAPLVTILRLAAPPPIAGWQPLAGLLSSGLATVALVWVAGRVFRAGFLLVGRPAKMRELVGWILKG